MANNFIGVASCKAWWRFENGALTTDSKGGNTLTAYGPPTVDLARFKEGASSVFLNWNQGYYIEDANLQAGFPLKSGDTAKLISVAFWMYITTFDTNFVVSKYTLTAGSFVIWFNQASGLVIKNNSDNFTGTDWAVGHILNLNRWYHVGVAHDGKNKTTRVRLWDDTLAQAFSYEHTWAFETNISNGRFNISTRGDASWYDYIGNLDELVIFNDLLSDANFDSIRQGLYEGATPTDIVADPFILNFSVDLDFQTHKVEHDWKAILGKHQSWNFEPLGASKTQYNEGDLITDANEVMWNLNKYKGGGKAITPRHAPCGYWAKHFIPRRPPWEGIIVTGSAQPFPCCRVDYNTQRVKRYSDWLFTAGTSPGYGVPEDGIGNIYLGCNEIALGEIYRGDGLLKKMETYFLEIEEVFPVVRHNQLEDPLVNPVSVQWVDTYRNMLYYFCTTDRQWIYPYDEYSGSSLKSRWRVYPIDLNRFDHANYPLIWDYSFGQQWHQPLFAGNRMYAFVWASEGGKIITIDLDAWAILGTYTPPNYTYGMYAPVINKDKTLAFATYGFAANYGITRYLLAAPCVPTLNIDTMNLHPGVDVPLLTGHPDAKCADDDDNAYWGCRNDYYYPHPTIVRLNMSSLELEAFQFPEVTGSWGAMKFDSQSQCIWAVNSHVEMMELHYATVLQIPVASMRPSRVLRLEAPVNTAIHAVTLYKPHRQ